jgi:hypothetical protein
MMNMTDLNRRVHRRRANTLFPGGKIYFADLLSVVLQHIAISTRIEGCVAWLTHPQILKALAKCPGRCHMVVTGGTRLTKRQKAAFRRAGVFVRVGSSRARMHHKFIVGYNDQDAPFFVLTGSFNYSLTATRSLENVIRLESPAAVRAFTAEFAAVAAAGRPV